MRKTTRTTIFAHQLVNGEAEIVYLTGNLSDKTYSWTLNPSYAYVFRSEAEAIEFEEGPAREFLEDTLTHLETIQL